MMMMMLQKVLYVSITLFALVAHSGLEVCQFLEQSHVLAVDSSLAADDSRDDDDYDDSGNETNRADYHRDHDDLDQR